MPLDVLVSETTLPDFLEHTAKKQATDIRALTVTIDYDQLVAPNKICEHSCFMAIHDSLTAQTLWTHLRRLARSFRHMTSLTTFAFIVAQPKCTFWLPRDILTDLVRNLPQRCRNLEIDTNALDRVREEEGSDDHLCRVISLAIPQLQHLRLRLATVCTDLFKADPAPVLETVSVSCIGGDTLGSGAQICDTLPANPLMAYHAEGNDAALPVARSLQTLATHCPKLELATVMSVTPNHYADRSTYSCFSIRDALANRTHALPFFNILGLGDGSILLRAKSEGVISDRATIALLAEGQPWKETTDGVRLPAAMFAAEDSPHTAKPLRLLSVAEWKEQNPTKSCSLWANEEKTGCRLIDATVLEGLGEHAPLKENTPGGFGRGEDKSDLWPVDGGM